MVIDPGKTYDRILVWADSRTRKTWDDALKGRRPSRPSMVPEIYVRSEIVEDEINAAYLRIEELEMVLHKVKVELNAMYMDAGLPPAQREMVRMADETLTGNTTWKKRKTARQKRIEKRGW